MEQVSLASFPWYSDTHPGYTATFENGRLISVCGPSGKLLSVQINEDGYRFYHLNKFEGGKQHKAYEHRLVCYHYNGPPTEDCNEVDHIDHDRTNNCANNLRWVSHHDNLDDCWYARVVIARKTTPPSPGSINALRKAALSLSKGATIQIESTGEQIVKPTVREAAEFIGRPYSTINCYFWSARKRGESTVRLYSKALRDFVTLWINYKPSSDTEE